MSEIRVDSIGNESNTGGPVLSGITTFSGQQYFIPPKGTTAERPSDCPPGSIRFNTDTAHLEYFNGLVWLEFEASSVEVGIATHAAGDSGGTGYRGLIGGGILNAPAYTNAINYITISTLGDSQDFGDLSDGRATGGSLASSTRCFWAGGYSGSGFQNNIQYVTISSTGDTENFGDLSVHGTAGRMAAGGLSNSTRGLFVAGQNSPGSPYFTDGISYITLASNGDDIDFGDAREASGVIQGMASPVRGVWQHGNNPRPISYVTISTTGNAQDFGNLSANIGSVSAASNSVRGIFAGGYISNRIDYVTIASTGNAQDFGDLTQARFECVGMSSPTRAVFGAGTNSPNTPLVRNAMDYVEIMTTGNAIDFGDVTYGTSGTGRHPKGSSNGHGGL